MLQSLGVVTIAGHSGTAGGQAVALQVMQLGSSNASAALTSAAAECNWVLSAPKGRYPDGSKQLHGEDRTYIISPLGKIVDERYTAYFEFDAQQ